MRLSNVKSNVIAALVAGASLAVYAEDGVEASTLGQPSPEYLAQQAELERMLSSRDLELFEVSFQALALDRIVIKDRLGNPHLYHYLAFRIRNQVGSAGPDGLPLSQAKAYNEVLSSVVAQYEQAKLTKDDGVGISVDAAEPKDGVIVERQDARTTSRKLDLSVLASNERGTRLRLLDDPIGSGPQETFNFPDLGQPIQGTPTQYVRDLIEEVMGRKLLTVDEIRAFELPAYDASQIVEHGWPKGQIDGVVIFNHLSEYGKRITIEVRGLTNKLRERWPESQPGTVENYLGLRIYRRVFTLRYAYPGDEFFRDLDRFELVKAGWEWSSTFQRNSQRRTIAYSRYYLNNIAGPGDILNQNVEREFWEEYNEIRAQKGDKLPDLQAEITVAP